MFSVGFRLIQGYFQAVNGVVRRGMMRQRERALDIGESKKGACHHLHLLLCMIAPLSVTI